MNTAEITIKQILGMAQRLKPGEIAQLISHLATRIGNDLEESAKQPPPQRRSLYGALADLGAAPSAEEIDEARREMWANFPREDF
ncbi:MAG: hypothetical protein ACREEM_35495 [Blastocatellia bacterium]